MNIIALTEADIVAELTASESVDLADITYHASIDGIRGDLPAVIVMADAKPLIPTNSTYEVTVNIDLHTSADDLTPDQSRAHAKSLAALVASAPFFAALRTRAQSWYPIRLFVSGFDAVDTEDRRFVQRVQIRLIAQA